MWTAILVAGVLLAILLLLSIPVEVSFRMERDLRFTSSLAIG